MGVRPGTIHIVDAVGQVQTCDLQMEDKRGALNYQVHQTLTVSEGIAVIFKGSVDETALIPFESPSDVNASGAHTGTPVGARYFEVKGVGPSHLATRLVTGAFSAQARVPISTVVSALAAALGVTLSIGTNPAGLTLANSFLSEQETLFDAFTRLADIATYLSGVPHIWKVAWDTSGLQTFVFQPVTSLVATSSIGLSGYKIRSGSIRFRTTREQFSNSVVLKLDRYLKDGGTTQTDAKLGSDIFLGTLSLTSPLASAPTVRVNDDEETVGIKDIDTGKQWYYALGSNVLTVGTSAAGGSDTIDVSYAAHDLRAYTLNDNASIAAVGTFRIPIQAPDSGNVSSPAEYAASELIRRSSLVQHLTCQVECPPGVFSAGQLIPVVVTGCGSTGLTSLTGYFWCQSITTTDQDLTQIWRTFELVRGPMLYRAGQFLRRIG